MPLHHWFAESLGRDRMEILVNSYHHQGVKRLAQRFVPMAFAPDGLIEEFYDPDMYYPNEGKFMMGIQLHPERMRDADSDEFDYAGCPCIYKNFVKVVAAYQKKLSNATKLAKPLKLERRRKVIVRSFSLASDIHSAGKGTNPFKGS